MTTAKIDIKVGIVEFSGEGESKWLAEQLDKILDKIPDLLKIELANPQSSNQTSNETPNNSQSFQITSTLAKFLKDKDATKNQRKKFLATALWLHHTTGKKKLSTSDVTKALSDNQQSRMGNASDTLNQNVSQGFIQKEGNNEFYVTPEGLEEILGKDHA